MRWADVLAQLECDGSEWACTSRTRASLDRAIEDAMLARAGCGRRCDAMVHARARVAVVVDDPPPPPYVAALARRGTRCICS